MRSITVRGGSTSGLTQSISVGPHTWHSDEPAGKGGQDSGPEPYELLLASLGSCTAITLRLYAARKAWPLGDLEINVAGRRDGERFVIEHRVKLSGALDPAQRARLLDIATRCPVHRTLSGPIVIETVADEG